MHLLIVVLFILAGILCGLSGFGVGVPRIHLLGFGCAAGWFALLFSNWPGV